MRATCPAHLILLDLITLTYSKEKIRFFIYEIRLTLYDGKAKTINSQNASWEVKKHEGMEEINFSGGEWNDGVLERGSYENRKIPRIRRKRQKKGRREGRRKMSIEIK